jgi:hypothetical protein
MNLKVDIPDLSFANKKKRSNSLTILKKARIKENVKFLIENPNIYINSNLKLYDRHIKTDGNTSDDQSQDMQEKNIWDSDFDSEEDIKI